MSGAERASERVRRCFEAIRASDERALWISVVAEDVALARAKAVEARVDAGEALPLAGLVGALKDNIDLLGLATTAGCPAYSFSPERSASCVERLVEAGLILIGKLNLDQFATGLVGTRTPYGALASVGDPSRISGGSSSGSAVAVALGLVDLALGTDTAGSGRVPAAFNGIVGLKPTRGLVPLRGVVPACASLDCVSIFARDVTTASRALVAMVGPDPEDPSSRTWPAKLPPLPGSHPVIGIADDWERAAMTPACRAGYEVAMARMAALGAELREVDISFLVEAGALLYGGAFVAERYAAVGAFVDAHRDAVDPVVGSIISNAAKVPAHQLVRDLHETGIARLHAAALFDELDALMLPTVPEHPTFEEVAADPVGVNTRLGYYSTFCNLLDLAALAVPLRETAGAPPTFGVTLFGPAFSDEALIALGATFLSEAPPVALGLPSVLVAVVGAHLSGQPLNGQLTTLGARLVRSARTSSDYRLYALETTPPRPGLVRVESGAGAPIEVEVWALSPADFAAFTSLVAQPLAIGPVELDDGTVMSGFLLAGREPSSARDITAFGGWRSYLADASPPA